MRILNCGFTDAVRYIPTARPEVKELKIHGKEIALDVNSLLAVQLNGEDAEDLKRADIFEGKFNSIFKPQFPPPSRPRPGGVSKLCLIATHGCNLACRYCYVRKGVPPRRERPDMMRFELAKEAILRFFNKKARLDVGFFGGEPLLNWELIFLATEFVKELAEKRGVKYGLGLTTNGTLLDESKVKYLDENGFSLIVSLDGEEKTHDLNRPLKCGEGSWRRTLRGLQLISRYKIARRTVLRGTFTPDCIKLKERLSFLNGLIRDTGCARGVSVEPASLSEDSCITDKGLAFTEKHLPELQNNYHEASKWYLSEIARGNRPSFRHYEKILQRLCWAEHKGSECGAGRRYITISPDGTIYTCHREGDTKIGNLAYGFDEEKRAKWTDNRFYGKSKCPGCWARFICGGGCRYNALEKNRDITSPDEISCEIMKIWIKECLWVMTQLDHGTLTGMFPKPGRKAHKKKKE